MTPADTRPLICDGSALPDAETLLQQLHSRLAPHITDNTALIGIFSGGAWIVERLQKAFYPDLACGILDVSFYRDDYNKRGLSLANQPTKIPFEVEGRDIILVDDVLYTGRTIRAAMNEIFDYGRPNSIKLAVLVRREGRQLPIEAAFSVADCRLQPNQKLQLSQDEQGKLSLTLETRQHV